MRFCLRLCAFACAYAHARLCKREHMSMYVCVCVCVSVFVGMCVHNDVNSVSVTKKLLEDTVGRGSSNTESSKQLSHGGQLKRSFFG